MRFTRSIDSFSTRTGRFLSWTVLLMVLVQFAVVVMRYVFGIGSIWMQEFIIYLHGMLFMLYAAYTLQQDAHVRVDIFYREASPRYQAMVNLAGTILFLWPFCYLIVHTTLPYALAAWQVREGSREVSGLPILYLLKSVIPLFATLVALQGMATVAHAVAILRGQESPSSPPSSRL